MMETGIYEKRVRFTGYYFRTGASSVHGGRKSYSTVCFNLSRGEVTHFYFIIMANKFKDDVVFTMLEIIREMNCLKMIDGRRIKNSDVYAKIAGKLNNHYGWEGDNTVNGMQINTKWKALKTTYRNEHQQANKSGKNFFVIKMMMLLLFNKQ